MKSLNFAFSTLVAIVALLPLTSQADEYMVPQEGTRSLWQNAATLPAGTSIGNKRVQIYVDVNPRVQRLHVIIDGHQIRDFQKNLDWKISSGKPGFSTKTGIFTLDNRWRMAYSNAYENAEMPWAQFFTRGKVGIHGTGAVGRLGTIASHGCVRLHTRNAYRLFQLTQNVLIANCTARGIAPQQCPLYSDTGIPQTDFKLNPSRDIGVFVYHSGVPRTMIGLPNSLPFLARNARIAANPVRPVPRSTPAIDAEADRQDQAFEQEDAERRARARAEAEAEHRAVEEANRQMRINIFGQSRTI